MEKSGKVIVTIIVILVILLTLGIVLAKTMTAKQEPVAVVEVVKTEPEPAPQPVIEPVAEPVIEEPEPEPVAEPEPVPEPIPEPEPAPKAAAAPAVKTAPAAAATPAPKAQQTPAPKAEPKPVPLPSWHVSVKVPKKVSDFEEYDSINEVSKASELLAFLSSDTYDQSKDFIQSIIFTEEFVFDADWTQAEKTLTGLTEPLSLYFGRCDSISTVTADNLRGLTIGDLILPDELTSLELADVSVKNLIVLPLKPETISINLNEPAPLAVYNGTYADFSRVYGPETWKIASSATCTDGTYDLDRLHFDTDEAFLKKLFGTSLLSSDSVFTKGFSYTPEGVKETKLLTPAEYGRFESALEGFHNMKVYDVDGVEGRVYCATIEDNMMQDAFVSLSTESSNLIFPCTRQATASVRGISTAEDGTICITVEDEAGASRILVSNDNGNLSYLRTE